MIYPYEEVFKLKSTLEEGILSTVQCGNLTSDTLFQATEAICELPSISLVGCKQHAVTLTHKIISYYLTTRMYFLCKQNNKNNEAEKLKTREKRKLAKLSLAADDKVMIQNISSPKIAIKKQRKVRRKKSIIEQVPQASIETKEVQNLFVAINVDEIFEPFSVAGSETTCRQTFGKIIQNNSMNNEVITRKINSTMKQSDS